MTVPPTYHLNELGPQAQMMSRNCNNERVAMILQYVALGSMIIMTGLAASQVLKRRIRSRLITAAEMAGQDEVSEHSFAHRSSKRHLSRHAKLIDLLPAGGQPLPGSRAERREPSIAHGS